MSISFFRFFLACEVKNCVVFLISMVLVADLNLHGDDVYFTLENSSSDVSSNTASSKVLCLEFHCFN